jgi:hypothetical protein
MRWVENNFFDHLDKFANSLGYDNYEIAIPLAMVPWESPEDRDIFILTITGNEVQGGSPDTFTAAEVK